MEADVSAIRNKIVGGVASAAPVLRSTEGFRELSAAITGALSSAKAGKTKDIRGGTENFIYGSEQFLKDLKDPNKNALATLQKYGTEFGDALKSIGGNVMEKLKIATEDAKKGIKGDSLVSRLGSSLLSKIPTSSSTSDVNTTTNQSRTQQVQQEVKSIAQNYGATTSSKVEMGGKIVIDVNLNGAQGLNPTQVQELQKILSDKFRELNIQNYIVNISTPPDAMGKPK